MPDDLFAHPSVPCPECGGRDGGHYIDCSIMAKELGVEGWNDPPGYSAGVAELGYEGDG